MAETIAINQKSIIKLRKDLQNPDKILKQIGAILVGTSQKAFNEQRLGSIPWAARYPNQSGMKINVAGVVADLTTGGTVKQRRFVDRPALSDTGALRRSISKNAISIKGSHTVEVGSVLPYSGRAQSGGESELAITATVKKRLAKFLKFQKTKGLKRKRSSIGNLFADKLGFLFQKDVLKTKVVPRPFLGITDEANQGIREAIEKGLVK